MQEPRDLPSSQPRPGRYGSYPPLAASFKTLTQMQKASIRNIRMLSTPNKLTKLPVSNRVPQPRHCPFTQRLSTDVRRQIYTHLLTNALLSTSEAISPATDFGTRQKYELHPSILRTCKEVYEEASAVLYGLNVFYIVATKSLGILRVTLADFIGGSALTRYWREHADVWEVAPEAGLYLCKVRQWRVEISSYGSPGQADIELPGVWVNDPVKDGGVGNLESGPHAGIPPSAGLRWRRDQYIIRVRAQKIRDTIREDMVTVLQPVLEYSLVPFCHLVGLCEEPPHTLEVIIKAQEKGEVPLRSEYLGLVPTESEKFRMIQPLEMLRGLQSMKFTHGASSDEGDTENKISSWQLAKESALKQLVTSKEKDWPVEYPSKIYTKLLSYAQAFERYEPFKQQMAAKWLYQYPYKTQSPNPIQYSNPFGPHNDNFQSDPINQHLSYAASAVRRHDTAGMMKERKAVIEYLEPQYARIVCEARKFQEFVEKQSKRYGIWDGIVRLRLEMDRYTQAIADTSDSSVQEMIICEQNQRLGHRIGNIDFAEALVVLEEYAEAFDRDVSHEIRKEIAQIRFEYRAHYDFMEREVAIQKLRQMVVDIPKSLDDAAVRFKELYMIAANDMQKQYLEIREARKRLFEHDMMGDVWECPIDLQMEIEDKEIDWKVPRDDPSFPDKVFKYKY